jgi:hypothetical protein
MREKEAEEFRSPWWDGALRCLFLFLSFSPSKLPCYPYPSSPLGEVISNDITRSHNAPWHLHVRKLSVVTTRYAPRGNETGAVRHLIHLESGRLDQCFCPSFGRSTWLSPLEVGTFKVRLHTHWVARQARLQPLLWFLFIYTELQLTSGFDLNDCPSHWCNLCSGDQQFAKFSGKYV